MANNLLWSPDNNNNILTNFTNYLKNKNYFNGNDYNYLMGRMWKFFLSLLNKKTIYFAIYYNV